MFGGTEVTIEDILNKMLVVQDNVGDFCRAYILLAFGEFYFRRIESLAFTDYARLLDDLDAIHSYNWAPAVYGYLVDSLSKAAVAIHRGTNEHQTHVWLCGYPSDMDNERCVNWEPPSTRPEHLFPRFINWPILTLRKKRMKEAFENARVTVALTATNDELKERIVRDAL